MKVLVIGRGAREHALGWKLKQSQHLEELFFAPGNSATSSLGKNLPFEPTDIDKIADWAAEQKIDLTVVGPENPLMMGIKEKFSQRGLLLFGPTAEGAQLEGSKIWAKEFMTRNGIPTAASRDFNSYEEALQYVSQRPFPLVVKADGLAEGKGVAVCENLDEADRALKAFLLERTLGSAGERVIVEDFLEGQEVSVFALCDGKRLCYFGEARDYKRVYDGDHGPNTGGMGAFSNSSAMNETLRKQIREQVFNATLQGLIKENIVYQGVIFAGLMLTRKGPKVLEFNVRFGDPETQVLLPRFNEDLLLLLRECAEGNLTHDTARLKADVTVGVVIAVNGYPTKSQKGIELPSLLDWPEDVLLFHAATSMQNGKVVNQGGRTLTAVASSDTLEHARRRVYNALETRSWGSYFFRKDIGTGFVPMMVGNA